MPEDLSLVLPFLHEMRSDLRADIAGLRTDVVNTELRLSARQSEDRENARVALSAYETRTDRKLGELESTVDTLVAFRNRLIGMAIVMPVVSAVGAALLTRWLGGGA